MNHRGAYVSKKATISAVFAIAVSGLALLVPLLHAQKEEMQARVAELKESMAKNKQALAQYTWHETDTIKLKGEVKKTSNFQVRMGPDGKPQKTSPQKLLIFKLPALGRSGIPAWRPST